MGVMTASTLLAYVLYTQDPDAVGGEKHMIWTVPFVIYGIFRYLYLIHKKDKDEVKNFRAVRVMRPMSL